MIRYSITVRAPRRPALERLTALWAVVLTLYGRHRGFLG